MTFRDLRRDVCKGVFLNTANFAEEVTYVPKAGVNRTVTVHVAQETEMHTDDSGDEWHIEKLVCLCFRDPADLLVGGIDDPQLGDGIVRDSVFDPNPNRYVFSGEKRDVKPEKWRLVFIRKRRTGQSVR